MRRLLICPRCRGLRHSIVLVTRREEIIRHEHFCEACNCALKVFEIPANSEPRDQDLSQTGEARCEKLSPSPAPTRS